MPLLPYCHFERMREIFFVCGQEEAGGKRKTGNTVLHAIGDHGASFEQLYEGKRKTGNEKDPSAALGMTKRGNASAHFFLFCGSQPPPLRSTSFRGKEGEPRMPLSPHRHFERMREIFFVRGKTKDVRIAASGKHRPPNDWGSRRFLRAALRRKTETGNEKDPSAALGMTKRGNASIHFFYSTVSQPPPLRGTSFQRKEGECRFPYSKAFQREKGNDMRMPLSPYRHFERTREIFFVCGQEEAGEQRKTGNTVLPATGDHGASCRQLYEGNGNGKRKRSLGCVRYDETRKRFYPFLFIPRQPTSAPSGPLLPEEGGGMPPSL